MDGEGNTHKKRNIDRYFSENARYWREIYSDDPEGIDRFFGINIMDRKTVVLGLLDKYAGSSSLRILDAGCGTGAFVKEVLKRGHSVVGMDLSQQMIKETRKATTEFPPDRVLCVRGDLEQMPFQNNLFDVILCIGVLSYVQNENICLQNMSDIVKPGGLIILALPNKLRISELMDPYYLFKVVKYKYERIFARGENRNKHGDDAGDTLFNMRRYYLFKMVRSVNKYNLCVDSVCSVGFGPINIWKKAVLTTSTSLKISYLLEKLSRRKCFYYINHIANHFIICLKKTTYQQQDIAGSNSNMKITQ